MNIDRLTTPVYDGDVAEYSVFDKLVAGLSGSERRQMLERISSAMPVAEREAVAEPETIDVEAAYRSMGLLRRIAIAIIAFFTGRETLSVVESYLLNDLRRSVAARLPHGLDGRDQLRPGAADDIVRLTASARALSAIVSRVMGRERQEFLAFLVGLHDPELQERLLAETDPFRIGASDAELKESEVRRRALHALEECSAVLPRDVRRRIYGDVRALHHVAAFSTFPFERLRAAFAPSAGEPVSVPLSRISEELARMASIYDGLRPGPSAVLLQALALYDAQDQLAAGLDVESLVQSEVERYSEAVSGLMEFGHRYPVADLVRLAHSNLHYRPTPLTGGEDWFSAWKSFWKNRIEDALGRYSYQRRVDTVVADARRTLGLERVDPFPGYPPSGLDRPSRHGLSMGLLYAVMGEPWARRISGPLGLLLRDGEFYKSDNRAAFDAAMHAIGRVQTDVANLEVRLRPSGDLGMAWAAASDGTLAEEAAEERRLALVAALDGESSALVRRAADAFRTCGDILQGVLYGTVGGKFDTVSNLADIASRAGAEFRKQLENAHVACKSVAQSLVELQSAETRPAQN